MMTDKNNQLSHLLNDPALRSVRIPYEEIHVGARIGSTSSTGHFRGRWQHQDVAIRRLSRDLGRTHCHVEELLHQAKLAAKLRHPHIVHVYGVAWNDVNEVSVLTEFVPGGDLRTLLETYSTAKIPVGFDNVEKVRIAYEIALALRFMHSARVMHRNLKSRSIFLSKRGDVKVMAFGTACNMDENYKRTRAGTIRWMAPEVLKGRAYDASADIFSFGAVLAELDNFKRPYEYDDADHAVQGGKLTEIEVARFVIRKKLSIRFSRCQSTCPEMIDMYNLAMACVAFDPNDRPSVQDVLNVLKRALKMLAIGIIGT
ncbi:TPA: hypothetical protein N0F65_004548 [Lagenidium giganteum]|uniref:Protein kinase domain-containing protein n=1 Tax=Lagenidium giganteum TaxID=4803 RepID=A0AAV2ZFM2_9STRA|nr:TPA: hypothetical protein N0F65_004548 [Lagenidium giganteum]